MSDFLGGASMVASLVIALVFFGYWHQTRDRLFLMFSGGFLIFSVSRLILSILEEEDEGRVFVYGLRMLAFLLILAAIIDKNRGRAPAPASPAGNGHVPRTGPPRPPAPTRRRAEPY